MRLLLLALLAIPVFAQDQDVFSATSGDVTVNAAATTTFTVQQPATGAKQVRLWRATASCATQAFTLDQKTNSTPATATAVTAVQNAPIKSNPAFAATVTAWKSSNVAGGTTAWSTLPYASGIAILDLSQITMFQTGTGTNYSIILTNSGGSSCTARITIQWKEGDIIPR